MGVEYRSSNQYVYDKLRIGNKVASRYVGRASDANAALIAKLAEMANDEREWRAIKAKAEREKAVEVNAAVRLVARAAGTVATLAMLAAGYRRHQRGEWRRMSKTAIAKTSRLADWPDDLVEREKFIQRAHEGDPETREPVRALMVGDFAGVVSKCGGDHAGAAAKLLIEKTAGRSIITQEAIRARFNQLKAELAGPESTPIERHLAEACAVAWLAYYDAEASAALNPHNSIAERRAGGTQRRYLSSLKTLASVRRLALPSLPSIAIDKMLCVTSSQPAPLARESEDGRG